MSERFIAHVDMDAFFASIEQRDNPSLKGKPVIVGADPLNGRGVVSTCSYEARKFGVRSAMPISRAWRLCPNGIYLRPNFEKYKKDSNKVYEIFLEFTPDVDMVSIDEAFLDISASYKLFGTPPETCLKIKKEIKRRTGLICSIGLAPSRMIAKIASDLEKPDGFVCVDEGEVEAFLRPLDISKIWGIGPKTAGILKRKGFSKIGDIMNLDLPFLKKIFGARALEIKNMLRGKETRFLERETNKSLSREITFAVDLTAEKEIKAALLSISDSLSEKLRKKRVKAGSLSLKMRFADFKTFTRNCLLPYPTNYADVIYRRVIELFEGFRSKGGIRLLGIKASRFSGADERLLFEQEGELKREKMHRALESIRHKFGRRAIYRAGEKIMGG